MLPDIPLSSDLSRGTMVNMSIQPQLAAVSQKVACTLATIKGNDLPQVDNILQINTCRRDGASIPTRAGRCHLGWNLEEAFHLKRQARGILGIECIRYHPELH